jgi:hypothetical protein
MASTDMRDEWLLVVLILGVASDGTDGGDGGWGMGAAGRGGPDGPDMRGGEDVVLPEPEVRAVSMY